MVKLKDGTLWVTACSGRRAALLLDELGPVGHIVLPCNALVARPTEPDPNPNLAEPLATLALTRTRTLA